MNPILQQDLKEIATILEKVKQQGIDFLKSIETIPTSNNSRIDANRNLNDTGIGALSTLEEFNQRSTPLMVSQMGPRYWGFVSGVGTCTISDTTFFSYEMSFDSRNWKSEFHQNKND